MDKNNKLITFEDFTKKAYDRMEVRKKQKTAVLYVPSIDANIKIRGITDGEFLEIQGMNDNRDPYAADKYTVYISCIEPSLKDVAVKMKKEDKITEYTDVVKIFEFHEIQEIAGEIMKLSGIVGEQSVSVVDSLKN